MMHPVMAAEPNNDEQLPDLSDDEAWAFEVWEDDSPKTDLMALVVVDEFTIEVCSINQPFLSLSY